MKDIYKDAERPWQWQDKLVVTASCIAGVVLTFILIWG